MSYWLERVQDESQQATEVLAPGSETEAAGGDDADDFYFNREPDDAAVRPDAGGIAFFVTNVMKQQLRARGFSDERISNLTPQEAHDILDKGVHAPPDLYIVGPEPDHACVHCGNSEGKVFLIRNTQAPTPPPNRCTRGSVRAAIGQPKPPPITAPEIDELKQRGFSGDDVFGMGIKRAREIIADPERTKLSERFGTGEDAPPETAWPRSTSSDAHRIEAGEARTPPLDWVGRRRPLWLWVWLWLVLMSAFPQSALASI